jgi:hypothetical protein
LRHIRDAVHQTGYVSRGRITSAIFESYRPFEFDEKALRNAIDDAIYHLEISGDIDELATEAGRGYAATQPRRIAWGGQYDALLGRVEQSSDQVVRRVTGPTDDLIEIPLNVELGRPAWRNALVELGGADQPDGTPSSLSSYVGELARSGEPYLLEEPNALAVLSGVGEFFGKSDLCTGRWARADKEGVFAAVLAGGYIKRHVFIAIEAGGARVWTPPSRDIWRWAVIGDTLEKGYRAWRYDEQSQRFDFLTPPPRQAEQAVLLTGEKINSWSWQVDARAATFIAELLGSPRSPFAA